MHYSGRIFVVAGILAVLSHFFLVDVTRIILTGYFNIDVNYERLLRLHTSFLLLAICLLCLGCILLCSPNQKDMILKFMRIDSLKETTPIFLTPENVLKISMLISFALSIVYYMHLMLDLPLNRIFYKEDGVLESLTAIGFGLASLFVAKYLIIKSRQGISGRNQRLIFLMHICVSFIFFIICMEEISWGQRIFNWNTPAVLESVNWQQETNIHNMFNGIWPILYQIAGLCFVSFFCIGWCLYAKRPDSYWLPLFPHPSLLGVAIFIGVVSLVPSHELIEQLASVFAFYYSLRMVYLLEPEKKFSPVNT